MLHDKYLFPRAEADAIASFLNPMLRLHPDKRAKASDLVHHNWLDGVVVQGEIDVIRRAEETEKIKRETSNVDSTLSAPNGTTEATSMEDPQSTSGNTAPTSRQKKRLSGLTQSEADAMKPVGEVEEVEEEDMDEERQDSNGHRPPPILSAAPVPASTHGKENTPGPRQGGKGGKRK